LTAVVNVALILGDDEGEAGDLGGEVAQFDAAKVGEREGAGLIGLAEAAVDLGFEGAELFGGDDEEIARAAGGIEDADAGEARAEVLQFADAAGRLAVAGFGEAGAEWSGSRKSGLSTFRMLGTLV